MNKIDRVKAATEFLNRLYGNLTQDYFSYLWFVRQKNDKETEKITIAFKVSSERERAKMAETAIAKNDEGFNAFLGVNLMDHSADKYQRAKTNDIVAQVAVVADIDIESAWHLSDAENFYTPDIATAKTFLPFQPTIFVDSGGGVHAYNVFNAPLIFENDSVRENAVTRNKIYIDAIRNAAGKYSKKIDGVSDLPRVLRMVGTYNLKNGRENAPLVKVIEYGENFSIDDLDAKISKFKTSVQPARVSAKKFSSLFRADSVNYNANFDAPPEYTRDLAIACFEYIDAANLNNPEWLPCISALKGVGFSMEEARAMCQNSKRYDETDFNSQWNCADCYDINTLKGKAKKVGFNIEDFKNQWYKQHASDLLAQVEKEIAAFDDLKTAAIETLQNIDIFDSEKILTDEILNAAALAEIFAPVVFTKFKNDVQKYCKNHDNGVKLPDLAASMKNFKQAILTQKSALYSRRRKIQAEIDSLNFTSNNSVMNGLQIPDGYSITDNGVEKITGEKSITICRRPLIICEVNYNVEEKKYKLILAYKTSKSKWQKIPAQGAEIIFNKTKLNDLAAYYAPVTSSNAALVVEYLDAFKAANENNLSVTYNVDNCGWYNFNDEDYFIDPRRQNIINSDGKLIPVVVDSNNPFTNCLTTAGSFEEWKKAYRLAAEKSPLARFWVASSIAPILLKPFCERNFALFLYGKTRAGKSTSLHLAASAVGNIDLIKVFDATNNGLLAGMAEGTNYAQFIDEKQAADKRLREDFQRFIYSGCNGVERSRAKKDGSAKKNRKWRTVLLLNGESKLIDDNATGGAYTRILQIPAPDVILDAETCKNIRKIIEKNYGHALPAVIAKAFDFGFENLRELFEQLTEEFAEFTAGKLLAEYCRYVAIVAVADTLLNMTCGIDEEKAISDATENSREILKLIPTIEEIDDTQRGIDFVTGFIAQNQKYFVGMTPAQIENLPYLYGEFADDFVYITAAALKQACSEKGFNYDKIVSDLIAAKFFIPDDKTDKTRKNPQNTVQKKIGKINSRSYRIPRKIIAN